jgi:hypothetical protein
MVMPMKSGQGRRLPFIKKVSFEFCVRKLN